MADISDELRRFIVDTIDSVEQLEVLLLLRRTAPRSWTPEQISDEIRTSLDSANMRLARLQSQGLVTKEPGAEARFIYSPKSSDVARKIDLLEEAYRIRKYRVMDIIFTKPDEGIRALADAFRFKRDSGHG